ncbi:skin secretory protein xP2-like [Xyrauchen texanus]|uniref:skin secretory protein xP2-like n=1 Tax=Xyrauchen texanus TaxID=154827 RepID=UPI00224191DB|nr:skin secretory protein xP2-like [Xyrauchen texanus]
MPKRMEKNKVLAKKRLRVPTQKMKDLSSPPPNEQSGCVAFVRWEDGYTGKIFKGSDILARDEAPVQLQDLRSGDPVLAKWSDGKFYKATVEYISGEDQAKLPKGHPTPQESFLNILKGDEPSDITSGSDTIIIDRSPLSEHGEKIPSLNPSPDGGLATGRNTAGPPPYGSAKGGTIGPSPYRGHTPSPSLYDLNTSGPSPGGGHTPSPSLYDLNTSGPSPGGGHTPSPSPYSLNTSGPSPGGGHAASPSAYSLNTIGPSPYRGHAPSPSPYSLNTSGPSPGGGHTPSPSLYDLNTSGPSPGGGDTPSPLLFHALFDHFFTVEECQNAVPFGRPGNNPSGKEGKQVLDRKKVDGILTYVLRCATLPDWEPIEEAKLKKAFVNKCRAIAGSKE